MSYSMSELQHAAVPVCFPGALRLSCRRLRDGRAVVLEGTPPPRQGPEVLLMLVVALLYTISGCASGAGGLSDPTTPGGPDPADYHGVGALERDNPYLTPVSRTVPVSAASGERALPTLAQACGLSEDSVTFEVSSSELSESAQRVLGSIGWCLTAGPLKGVDVEVIGFTEPRPDNPSYVHALATARASNVAAYLREVGVPSTRLEVFAAGEPHFVPSGDFEPVALEAEPRDEVRRVEIRIAPD